MSAYKCPHCGEEIDEVHEIEIEVGLNRRESILLLVVGLAFWKKTTSDNVLTDNLAEPLNDARAQAEELLGTRTASWIGRVGDDQRPATPR